MQATVIACSALAVVSAQAYDLKLGHDQVVTFHGFLSQGALYSDHYNYLGDTRDGSLQFTEIGVNASYAPFNRTRIAVQGFAFDTGSVGNLEPFLDYASIDYTFNDYIGIRGGRVRRPSGIYNHIQDVDLARTSVLLPQGIYDARWRDFNASMDGAELFGTIPMSKAGSLSYELYVGQLSPKMNGGIADLLKKSLAGAGGQLDSIDSFLDFGGQLWWNTPLDGFRLGVGASDAIGFGYHSTVNTIFGPFLTDSKTDSVTVIASAEYTWRNWVFQTEYSSLALDNSGQTSGPFGPSSTADKSHWESWYFNVTHRVTKWLEVGGYYNEFYPHSGVGTDASQKDAALSLRFDIKDWWIFKLEGHYIRGTALLRDPVNNPPPTGKDDWFMVAAKTTFSF